MPIRSNDRRPVLSGQINATFELISVPRCEWSRYKDGELLFRVYYRVPILGTHGAVIMDEQFDTMVCEFLEYAPALKFYKQKLASYNARKSARTERIYQENMAYFARISQMFQKQN